MTFLVMNCFHWVGYHIVAQLLENGCQVDGIAGRENAMEEHFSMFLGRNSNFKLKETEHADVYDKAIIVGAHTGGEEINAKCQFLITRKAKEQSLSNMIRVQIPLLFGEWMPMNEEGMFIGEQFIQFDSDYFLSEAVYVEDFISTLLQWLKTEDVPDQLEMRAYHTAEKTEACENMIYLHGNKTNKEQLAEVLSHYQRFQHLYP